jgi:hypothetical protein
MVWLYAGIEGEIVGVDMVQAQARMPEGSDPYLTRALLSVGETAALSALGEIRAQDDGKSKGKQNG